MPPARSGGMRSLKRIETRIADAGIPLKQLACSAGGPKAHLAEAGRSNRMSKPRPSIKDRIAALDWAAISDSLDNFGCAIVKSVLTRHECQSLAAMYDKDGIFRSTIFMARHGFGRGEYKYWSYPLPKIVAELRKSLYPPLVAVANRWNQVMKIDVNYPDSHEEYLDRCHQAGQTKPTPLLLNYHEGDWNALHQDVYGEKNLSHSGCVPTFEARQRFYRRRIRHN